MFTDFQEHTNELEDTVREHGTSALVTTLLNTPETVVWQLF